MSSTDDESAAVTGMGAKVLRIVRNIGDGPVLYLCDDDTEAESLAIDLPGLLFGEG